MSVESGVYRQNCPVRRFKIKTCKFIDYPQNRAYRAVQLKREALQYYGCKKI